MKEGTFGIKDSFGREIPRQEFDQRTKETKEVLSLLRKNPIVVLTAERPYHYGKSTFAKIHTKT